jgi:hypothetical protein
MEGLFFSGYDARKPSKSHSQIAVRGKLGTIKGNLELFFEASAAINLEIKNKG